MLCKTCGNEFTPFNAGHVYCSPQCRPSVYHKPTRILLRDKFKCFYCGKSAFADGVVLEVDHVRPLSFGGEPKAKNLVTACAACNRAKIDTIIVPPLLDEIQAEIDKRNLEFGLSPEHTFSFTKWYAQEPEKRRKRKAYEDYIAKHSQSQEA